jgi:hypothetical protein
LPGTPAVALRVASQKPKQPANECRECRRQADKGESAGHQQRQTHFHHRDPRDESAAMCNLRAQGDALTGIVAREAAREAASKAARF